MIQLAVEVNCRDVVFLAQDFQIGMTLRCLIHNLPCNPFVQRVAIPAIRFKTVGAITIREGLFAGKVQPKLSLVSTQRRVAQPLANRAGIGFPLIIQRDRQLIRAAFGQQLG